MAVGFGFMLLLDRLAAGYGHAHVSTNPLDIVRVEVEAPAEGLDVTLRPVLVL